MTLDEYWDKYSEDWKCVLDQEFVNIGVAIEKTNSPKEAINALLVWWQSVALDPKVSQEARDLYEQGVKDGGQINEFR